MYDNELTKSVILPRDDFQELAEAAFNQDPATAGQRVASVLQTTAISAALVAAFTGASWGWAKAIDWRERKQSEREIATLQFKLDNGINPNK